MRLVERHFPPSGDVCDIGSGPGRYSIALLQRGYRVTLVDLSSALLDRARAEIGAVGQHAAGYVQGDARDLSQLPSESFDAALLMGPMYHVIDSGERELALLEARRILRPGGRAIVAYLNSWLGGFPGAVQRLGIPRFHEA